MPETQTRPESPTDQEKYFMFFVGRLVFTTANEAKAAAGASVSITGKPVEIQMVEIPPTMKRSHFMTITEGNIRKRRGDRPR